MVGVRLPARILKRVDKIAEALACDRSRALRRLIESGLERNAYLLRTGKGRRLADWLVGVVAAQERAAAAERRASEKPSVETEIKASRAGEDHAERAAQLEDRLTRATDRARRGR